MTEDDLTFKPDELPRIARSSWSMTTARSSPASPARWNCAASKCAFAHSVAEGLGLIRQNAPAFAVVDMRLEDGNGLDVIAELSKVRPDARAVVLTGYGNIATQFRREARRGGLLAKPPMPTT